MSKRKQTFQRPIRMGGSPVNGHDMGREEILNLETKRKFASIISSASSAEEFNSPEEKRSNGDGPNDFYHASSQTNGIHPKSKTEAATPNGDPPSSRHYLELTREQTTAQTDPSPPPEENDEEAPVLNNKLAQLLTAAPSLAFPRTSADCSPFYTQPPGPPRKVPQESDPAGSLKLKDLLNAAKGRTPSTNGYQPEQTESNATEGSTPVANNVNGSPGAIIRPFACRDCGFAFTNKSNCERHMRKKHGKKSRRDLLKHYGPTTPNSCNSGSTRSSSGSEDGISSLVGPDTPKFRPDPARSMAQVNGSEMQHVTFKCRLCEEQFGKQDLAIKHVVLNHPQVENILETVEELETTPLAAAATPSPQQQTSESSSEPLDFSVSSKSRPGPDVANAQKPGAAPPQAPAALQALHRWLPPNPFFGPGWPHLGLPTTPYYSPEAGFANHRGRPFPEEAEMCDGREIKQEEPAAAPEFQDGGGGEEVLVGAELAAELPPTSSPFFDPRAVPYRTPGPRKFVCVYCHNTYSSRGNVNRHIRNTHFKMKRTSSSSGSGSVAGFTKRPNGSYTGPLNGHRETSPPMAVNGNGRSSSTSDGQSLQREPHENGVETCRSRSNLDRYYEEGSPPPAKIKRETLENGIEEAFRKYYSQYYYYPPYGPPREAASLATDASNGQHPCPPSSLSFFQNYAKSLAAPLDREESDEVPSAVEDTNGLDLSLVSSSRKKEISTTTTCLSSTPINGATNQTTACAKLSQNGSNSTPHSGMRPSPCPLCGLNFSTKSNRNRHIFRKHRQTYASIRGSFPVGCSRQPHPLALTNHCSFQNGDTAPRREEERDNYSSDECEREPPPPPETTEGKMDLVKEEEPQALLPFSCTICKEGEDGKTISFRDQASLLAHAFTRHKDELNTKYTNMIPAQPNAKPDRAGSVLSSYLAFFKPTTPGCSPEPSIAGDEILQQRQWLCTICRITFSLKHSLIRHHKRHAARSLNDPHNFVPVEMMLELSPAACPDPEETPLIATTNNNSLIDTTASLCGSRVLQNLLGIHDAKELEHLVMNQGAGTGGGVPSNA